MGSIAQYLNHVFSSAGQQPGTAFWLGVPQIALINVLLSGDTAVVIAMACRDLPARQRPWGMAIGAGVAALLLLIFAAIIAPILLIPYVKLIGGLVLIYIAVRLLVPENAERNGVAAAISLWRVARTVIVADVVLSLDNIIAIAAVARGNLALLLIGVAISIPIVLAGSALITALLARFPILVWAGAALLGWLAGDIMATDPAVSAHLAAEFGETFAHQIPIVAAIVGALLVIVAGAVVRRRA